MCAVIESRQNKRQQIKWCCVWSCYHMYCMRKIFVDVRIKIVASPKDIFSFKSSRHRQTFYFLEWRCVILWFLMPYTFWFLQETAIIRTLSHIISLKDFKKRLKWRVRLHLFKRRSTFYAHVKNPLNVGLSTIYFENVIYMESDCVLSC